MMGGWRDHLFDVIHHGGSNLQGMKLKVKGVGRVYYYYYYYNNNNNYYYNYYYYYPNHLLIPFLPSP